MPILKEEFNKERASSIELLGSLFYADIWRAKGVPWHYLEIYKLVALTIRLIYPNKRSTSS